MIASCGSGLCMDRMAARQRRLFLYEHAEEDILLVIAEGAAEEGAGLSEITCRDGHRKENL